MQGQCRCVKVLGSMLTYVEDEDVDPANQHRAQVRHGSEQKPVLAHLCNCSYVAKLYDCSQD